MKQSKIDPDTEDGLPRRLVGTSELANILGVTARRVRQMVAEGTIPKPDSRGRHDLAAAVQAVIAQARAGREGSQLSASRKSLFDLKARREALEVARLDGRLIELAEAEAMIAEVSAVFIASLGALPARLGGRDIAALRRIEAEIDAFRTEIAEKVTEMAENGPEMKE